MKLNLSLASRSSEKAILVKGVNLRLIHMCMYIAQDSLLNDLPLDDFKVNVPTASIRKHHVWSNVRGYESSGCGV